MSVNLKAVAIVLSTIASYASAEIKYSLPEVITYDDANEGKMTFSYSTYLDGTVPYQTGWLKGKIEIEDKGEKTGKDDATGEWTYSPTTWSDKEAVHVSIEFGLPGKELEFREQIRFIYPLDPAGKDVDSFGFLKTVENVYKFSETNDDIKYRVGFFSRLTPDQTAEYRAVDQNGKNGYTITGGSFDKDTKKMTIEFTRPFDVTYDFSFMLQPTKTYRLHVNWVTVPSSAIGGGVKGSGAILEGHPTMSYRANPAVNKGNDWVLAKPPGWDDLLTAKAVEEL